MIQPTQNFAENLGLLPSIDDVTAIELINADGEIVDTIANAPGKKGSLAVYQYLAQVFGAIDAKAAAHGLEVFAEHTQDAKNRPGAHPNIDRLLDIVNGAAPLTVKIQ